MSNKRNVLGVLAVAVAVAVAAVFASGQGGGRSGAGFNQAAMNPIVADTITVIGTPPPPPPQDPANRAPSNGTGSSNSSGAGPARGGGSGDWQEQQEERLRKEQELRRQQQEALRKREELAKALRAAFDRATKEIVVEQQYEECVASAADWEHACHTRQIVLCGALAASSARFDVKNLDKGLSVGCNLMYQDMCSTGSADIKSYCSVVRDCLLAPDSPGESCDSTWEYIKRTGIIGPSPLPRDDSGGKLPPLPRKG
jgi:hypothetical protein